MNNYSKRSEEILAQAHPDLVRVFRAVLPIVDHSPLESHRKAERQAFLVKTGASKTHDSRHLTLPSEALDVMPFPIQWPDQLELEAIRAGTIHKPAVRKVVRQAWGRLYLFAGVVLAKAHELGVDLEWGGAWHLTIDPRGNGFDDLAHWQLRRKQT